MSERERWIVYPLLFLALGAALRDKLLKQTQADNIACKQLIVHDDTGKVTGVLNGSGLQVVAVKATLVDAQRLQQGGKPVSTGSQGGAVSFPLGQLMPLLRALQGGTQPKAPLQATPDSTAAPKSTTTPPAPPTITIPVETAPANEPGADASQPVAPSK